MQTISKLPVMSRIEYIEVMRQMPILRRVSYSLWMSLLTMVVLFVALGASVVLAALGFAIIMGDALTLNSTVALAIPVICSFLVAMAFGERIIPETVVSGDTFGKALRRVFRSGLVTGVFSGLIFGLVWGFAVRMHGFYAQWLAPEANVDEGALILQILVSCVVMAIAIALPFALFRVVTGAIGQMMLHNTLEKTA